MRMNVVIRAPIAALLASLFASAAQAAPFSVGQPENLLEATKSKGFRLGNLIARPSFHGDSRYDTNIYNRANEDSDFVFVAEPSLRVESDWDRHAASLAVGAELRRYRDHPAENSVQLSGELGGRLDLGYRLTAATSLSVARRIEGRGTFGDQQTDRPVTYLEKQFDLSLSRTGGRLETTLGLRASDLAYENSTVNDLSIDQSFRDLRHVSLTGRASLRLSWRLNAFLSGSIDQFSYRRDAPVSRNSRGFSLLGGATFTAGLLQAEAAVGFAHQDFSNPLDKDFSGLDFNLKIGWTPQRRIRLALEGRRTMERSPILTASAVLETRFSAAVKYALGSNLLVGLEAGQVADAFRGTDRSDRRLFGEATAEYRLAPTVGIFVGAGYRNQHSSGVSSLNYRGTTFRLGVKFNP